MPARALRLPYLAVLDQDHYQPLVGPCPSLTTAAALRAPLQIALLLHGLEPVIPRVQAVRLPASDPPVPGILNVWLGLDATGHPLRDPTPTLARWRAWLQPWRVAWQPDATRRWHPERAATFAALDWPSDVSAADLEAALDHPAWPTALPDALAFLLAEGRVTMTPAHGQRLALRYLAHRFGARTHALH